MRKARVALEATFAANLAHADALYSLGVIMETSGDLKRATRLFRRAMAANPSLRPAHYHPGRIYTDQKHYPQALAEFGGILQPADNDTPRFPYAIGAADARAADKPKRCKYLWNQEIWPFGRGKLTSRKRLQTIWGESQSVAGTSRRDLWILVVNLGVFFRDLVDVRCVTFLKSIG